MLITIEKNIYFKIYLKSYTVLVLLYHNYTSRLEKKLKLHFYYHFVRENYTSLKIYIIKLHLYYHSISQN